MNYLIHYGVDGQRWGVRKYQNEDGSLTPLGREHYDVGSERSLSSVYGDHSKRFDSGDYTIPKGTEVSRNQQSNSDSSDKLINGKRSYSYVYDQNNDRDSEFYSQFGKKISSYEFTNDSKIAGTTSIAKALEEEYFDKPISEIDMEEFSMLDSRLKKYSNKEVSATYAPYDPKKTPEENRSHYEDVFSKAAARTVATAASYKRDDERDQYYMETGRGRDINTAVNDIAVKTFGNLLQKNYSGIRDYNDLGGNAGVTTPTIIFDDNATKKIKDIIL